MYYNPATESAVRTIEALAEANRKVIQKLNPPKPQAIVWCSTQGRWINNPAAA
jgi:hypothetical protein